MFINIMIGAVIFGYAGWSLYRFTIKSKEGKCASCSSNKSCASACDESTPAEVTFYTRYREEHSLK